MLVVCGSIVQWTFAPGGARADVGCPATTASPAEPPLPGAWEEELARLVTVTSRAGQPWSCQGARVSLHPRDGAMELRVELADGRTVARAVATPVDVVPTGEALLASASASASAEDAGAGEGSPPAAPDAPPAARGTPIQSPVRRASSPQVPDSPAGRSGDAPGSDQPRLLVSAFVSGRVTGPLDAFWGGFGLRALVPFGVATAGLWARFDLPAVVVDATPADFSMAEVSIGPSLGARLVDDPFELHAAFVPSVAVVSMEGGPESELAEGGRVDGRLGAELRATVPMVSLLRATVGVDGEFSPAAAASSDTDRRIDPALPPIPAFTVGVTAGLEVALP